MDDEMQSRETILDHIEVLKRIEARAVQDKDYYKAADAQAKRRVLQYVANIPVE